MMTLRELGEIDGWWREVGPVHVVALGWAGTTTYCGQSPRNWSGKAPHSASLERCATCQLAAPEPEEAA